MPATHDMTLEQMCDVALRGFERAEENYINMLRGIFYAGATAVMHQLRGRQLTDSQVMAMILEGTDALRAAADKLGRMQ